MPQNQLFFKALALLAAALSIVPSTSFSALEPLGPENLVNTTSSGYEATPHIVSDQNNNRLIVWTSEDRTKSDGPAILGQFYNQYREAVGPEMTLVPSTSNIARIPRANDYPHFAVTMWKDGSFALAWSETSTPDDETDNDYDLTIQFFNPDGSPSAPALSVSDTTDKEALPALSSNANSLVIAWQTFPNRKTKEKQNNAIKFKRYNKNGSLIGNTVTNLRLDSSSNIGRKPSVSLDNDNNVLIAWASGDNSIASQEDPRPKPEYSISGALFSQNNSPIGNPLSLGEFEDYPSNIFVADFDDTSFLAFWDTGKEGSESPQGRIIGKNGTLGKLFTNSTSSSDIVSGITQGNKGNAFIAWSRSNNGGLEKSLYIQELTANGEMGSPTKATSFTNTEENHVSLHMDRNGILVAAWESWIENDEDAPDIYARSFETKEDRQSTNKEDSGSSSGGSSGGSLPHFILLMLLSVGLVRKYH
ncbi:MULTISPECIES: hypothetical protein [Alcanivorax]|jgi:hypothetical protein|uniref:hypothetical protein n=1 Tax=Alcanivorax TaxID=59753 RepID=UPI002353F0E1|nr:MULTISPECIES: hypothetical protein [Alcanivorax]MDF1636473.1 hypothetical protein [Alcanivorax jadensis]|tara:strand:+ start:841 stop:2265 length:1425 start_codon:yes stop_codon:yes gene_type:complete